MSIVSWVLRNGELIEKGSAQDYATRRQADKRGDLPTPYVVRDTLSGPVQSQLDGQTYESRSDLYRAYKEGGVRIVEDGEKPVDYAESRPKVTKDDIGEALQKVRQGYKPEPLEQAGPDGEPPPLPEGDDHVD